MCQPPNHSGESYSTNAVSQPCHSSSAKSNTHKETHNKPWRMGDEIQFSPEWQKQQSRKDFSDWIPMGVGPRLTLVAGQLPSKQMQMLQCYAGDVFSPHSAAFTPKWFLRQGTSEKCQHPCGTNSLCRLKFSTNAFNRIPENQTLAESRLIMQFNSTALI